MNESNVFKEKSGVEVHVDGKCLIVYDNNANEIGKLTVFNYTWEVKV